MFPELYFISETALSHWRAMVSLRISQATFLKRSAISLFFNDRKGVSWEKIKTKNCPIGFADVMFRIKKCQAAQHTVLEEIWSYFQRSSSSHSLNN